MSALNPKKPASAVPAPRPPNEQKPEIAPGVFTPENSGKWKLAAAGVLVALLGGGAFAVWKSVQHGQNADRWERLATITDVRDDSVGDVETGAALAVDVLARDDYIGKLEDFIAKEDPDAAATIHAHSMVANLQMTQILAAASSAKAQDVDARYASAEKHWKSVKDAGIELPLTANRFRPLEAARMVDLLLKKLEVNRKWDAAHGIRPATTDADVLVLLRTTEGDLQLRLFSKDGQSPTLAKAFADRACKGLLDGTLLFAKRADSDEGWVRGGDVRIKETPLPATDEERLKWGGASPGDPILPEAGRHRIAHLKGTIAAWHEDDDPYDDPAQFLIETKDSPHLDTDYTPFGKVEEISSSTLERLAAAKTRADESTAIRMDAKLSKLADQLVKPVVIVKALVYDKGVLRACGSATKLEDNEKKLETVVPDATRIIPPPPPPPPTGSPEAAMDAGMDAGMNADTTPPAMTDAPPK